MSREKREAGWWAVEYAGAARWLIAAVPVLLLAGGAVAAANRPSDPEPWIRPSTVDEPEDVVERAAFMGDSYTVGAGSSGIFAKWTTIVSQQAGWDPTTFAFGGTSYSGSVTTDAKVACGLDYCPSYREAVVPVVDFAPDVVVVAGGRGDAARDPATVRTAIDATFDELRAGLPDATLYAVSPQWDDDEPPPGLANVQASVRDAVTRVGGTYLDIGEPLQGRPELIGGDGVHPTDEGYRIIAEATLAQLVSHTGAR